MMVIVGVPLFYMEASIGQFTSSGPMTCWKFAPLFKGTFMITQYGHGKTMSQPMQTARACTSAVR